jgi:hypothetical protein
MRGAFFVSLCCLLGWTSSVLAASEGQRPNVILIMTDDKWHLLAEQQRESAKGTETDGDSARFANHRESHQTEANSG